MAFDPDAYLASEPSEGGFDPDAYLLKENLSPGTAQVEKGFFDRVSDKFKERQLEGSMTGSKLAGGEITAPEAILRVAGDAAGLGLDVIGETLIEGYDTLLSDSQQKSVSDGIDWLFNETFIGRKAAAALSEGIEAWDGFKEENPRAAKNIESAVNVGLVFAPVKGSPKAAPSPIAKAATGVEHVAGRQVRGKAREFLGELIRKADQSEVFRTVQKGVLKKDVYVPTKFELGVMKEVSKVDGVSKFRGFQGNFNAIYKEIGKEANKLTSSLSNKVDKRIANVANARIDFGINNLKNSHLAFTGAEAQTIAARIGDNAKRLIAKHGSSPKGILKARQELDTLVKQQVSEARAFGEGTWAVANKTVRDMMNQTIDDFTYSVGVKQSLNKQSRLYSALDRIAPKAFKANKNAISRAFQDVSKVIGIRSKLLSEAALVLGTTTLGASQIISGPLAATLATGYTTYKVGQALGSATAKKGLAALLRGIDKALVSSKNPAMLKQLRAHRVAVLEVLEAHKDVPEKPEKDKILRDALQ